MQLQVSSSSNDIDDKLDVQEEATNEEADAEDGAADDAAADEEVQHPMSLEEETAVVQNSSGMFDFAVQAAMEEKIIECCSTGEDGAQMERQARIVSP